LQDEQEEALDCKADLAHRYAMRNYWATRMGRQIALVLLSVGLIGVVGAAGPTAIIPANAPTGRMARLPRLTLWVWERREDMRGLDAQTTAVAYLDRTVAVDATGLHIEPRRQGMLLPASTSLVRIAVVRIEVAADTALNAAQGDVVARAVSDAAAGDAVAALQVDFDARQSQREWYAGVLRRVRAQMPAEMPLSITALASWCSYDGEWMRALPVDEAVPMLFRMEPDRRRGAMGVGWGAGDYALREPLCMGSVGISTHEPWPPDMQGRRVYVFADRGWSRDGLQETVRSLE
jgi:hypothetical protein